MDDELQRMELTMPGVVAQAERLAEHTILPLACTSLLVRFVTARYGLTEDTVYENAIRMASSAHRAANSARIANEALTLLYHMTLP